MGFFIPFIVSHGGNHNFIQLFIKHLSPQKLHDLSYHHHYSMMSEVLPSSVSIGTSALRPSSEATVLETRWRWRQTQNVISVVLLHMTINRAADLRQDTDRLGAPSQWAWWVMKLVQHSVFIVCLREWRSPLRSLCIFHVSYAAGINGSNYALARARVRMHAL